MLAVKTWFCGLLLITVLSLHAGQQPSRTPGAAVLFEGARIIVGDSRPPFENGAFLVEQDRITRVGKKGTRHAAAWSPRRNMPSSSSSVCTEPDWRALRKWGSSAIESSEQNG